MKHKIRLLLSLSLIMSFLFVSNVFAYRIAPYVPSTKTLYWGYHNTIPTIAQTPARSNGNWGTSDGLATYYNFSTYSDTSIDCTDSHNSVGAMVSDMPGSPSGWIAMTLFPAANYSTFDIILHSDKTFNNGSGETYYDYQGVFAHEFGHVYGLVDLYPTYSETIGKTKSTVPTMFGANAFDGTNNIYYYLRTVETDDTNGKTAVANSIR